MLKVFLQSLVAIIMFVIGIFKDKVHKRYLWLIVLITVIVLVANGFMVYFADKSQKCERDQLKAKISDISQEGEKQREKIDRLLSDNSRLQSKVEIQSKKIDNLTQEIIRLANLLKESLFDKFAKTDSYTEAKDIYNLAIKLMNQGKNKEAAEKFLEFRDIAVKEQAYEAAAISSLIAAYRFEDIGEEVKAAKLQSEAGDFFTKLKRYDEAQIWKKNAKYIYQTQGFTAEAEIIDKEIKRIDLLLK